MTARVRFIVRGTIGLLVIWLIILLTGIALSRAALTAAQSLQLERAQQLSNYAQQTVHLLEFSCGYRCPLLTAWNRGLLLVTDGSAILSAIEESKIQAEREGVLLAIPPLATALAPIPDHLMQLTDALSQSWLLQRLIHSSQMERIHQAATIAPLLTAEIERLATDNHRWIVIFQNSDELRASGGFMGSYAIIEIKDGMVLPPIIEDIYDADGQFSGYIPAPPGVAEYLSGGAGLRLPDANWEADFPTAATQILQLFALSGKTNIEGVVVVSLPAAKAVLNTIGPLYLPDEHKNLSAEELSEFLSEHRASFFPGSTLKKDQLSQVMTQLQLKSTTLQWSEWRALATTIQAQAQQKNIMAYATNPATQQVLENAEIDGSIRTFPGTDSIALIESNVGINKANKNVERSVAIENNPTSITISVTWNNLNSVSASPEAEQHYVNYQRILVPVEWELKAVTLDGTAIAVTDTVRLKYGSHDEFQQIGNLVLVPAGQERLLQYQFIRRELPTSAPDLYYYHQPGIDPTSLTYHSPSGTKYLLVTHDQLLID